MGWYSLLTRGIAFWGCWLGVLVQGWAFSPTDSLQATPRKIGLSLIFDSRQSFIRSQPVEIYGLNIGVKYKERYRFGIGAYTAIDKFKKRIVPSAQNNNKLDTLSAQLRMSFINVNFAYTFYNSRWLELSAPIEVGLGRSHYTAYNTQESLVRDRQGTFVPVGLGFNAMFKLTRWIGVSGLVGYRKSLLEEDLKVDFDGWFYSYRLNIFLGNIVQDYRQHRERKRHSLVPHSAAL